MQRLMKTTIFVIVLLSAMYIVFIKESIHQVTRSRHHGCIAADGNHNTRPSNSSVYDVIYTLDNPTWKHLLSRSYSPVFRAVDMIEEEYPLAVDMVTLVENVLKKKEIYEKKINIYPYRLLTLPENACETPDNEKKKVFLLFLIKSSYRHFKRRQTIRETWANKEICAEFVITRVFMVGQTKDRNKLSQKIKKEIQEQRDILEIDVIDNYYNNTYKTMGGIKYVLDYCPQADHVMLVDDDFYVATDNLITLLKIMKAKKEKFIYMGWLNKNPLPSRMLSSKWYVTKEEYPYDFYPEFISAGAIVMGNDFVQNLYIASQYTQYFKFDDVYIAIVARKLQIYPQSNFLFYINKIDISDPEFWQVLASHGYNDADALKNAWKCHESIRKNGLRK